MNGLMGRVQRWIICVCVCVCVCSPGVKEVVEVKSKKYMNSLVEQANLHFIATGKVKETGQIVTAMKVVTLHNPKLTVTVRRFESVRPNNSSESCCHPAFYKQIYSRRCHCCCCCCVGSGVRRRQSERGDDGDRGVHEPFQLRPGGRLHPHGRTRAHAAHVQILQVSSSINSSWKL